MKCGIAATPKAAGASTQSDVLQVANTRFGLVFLLACYLKIGLMLMQGGQVGFQKSTIRPGEL